MQYPLILSLAAALTVAAPAQSFDRKAAIAAAAPYRAVVGRDHWGVPRVHGQTDADAAFALGYAFAEDDLPLIEEAMAASNGHRLIARDTSEERTAYLVQLFRIPEQADRIWSNGLAPATKAYLQAYADGINLYAAQHPKEIGRADLYPLSGKDIVRNSLFQTPLFYGMSGTLTGLLAPGAKRDLGRGQGLQVQRSKEKGLFGFLMRGDLTELGSNGFAVAPKRSGDGATRLIVNSHQPLEGPLAWLEASVSSDAGLNFAGGAFPGSPILLVGTNETLAWTATVNRPDLIDTYQLVINPKNANQYRLDGVWRDFETGEAKMRVRAAGRVTVTVKKPTRWSAHGPVLDTPTGPVAIRWATMDVADGLEASYRLMKAKTVAEARSIYAENRVGSTNRIMADSTGQIARFYLARMPVRIDGPDWRATLPGDDGRLIWTSFEPFDAMPHIENPPEGWLSESNSSPFRQMGSATDPNPANYPKRFGIETDMTNRARRATTLMGKTNPLGRDALWAIKMDDVFAPESFAAGLRTVLLAADWVNDLQYKEAIALIRGWDLTLKPDNRAAALAILTMQPIGTAMFQKQKPPELKDSMDAAIAFLMKHHGRLDIPWTSLNQLQRDGVLRPMSGGPDVLRAANSVVDPVTGTLKPIVGDGLVMLVEWDQAGRQTVSSVSPFGASGHKGDPHRTDQMDLFVAGKLKPVPMEKGARAVSLEKSYRPQDGQIRRTGS